MFVILHPWIWAETETVAPTPVGTGTERMTDFACSIEILASSQT